MKMKCLVAAAVVIAGSMGLHAGGEYAFDLTKEAKQMGGHSIRKGGVNRSEEEWAYHITLENKSSKEAENIDVKYILFMQKKTPEKGNFTNGDTIRKEGEVNVPKLKNFDKFTFDTVSVLRKSVQLQSGYVWRAGAGGPRGSKDSLSGLWVRVFVNGKLVMEYADPVSLPTKESWESK